VNTYLLGGGLLIFGLTALLEWPVVWLVGLAVGVAWLWTELRRTRVVEGLRRRIPASIRRRPL
jgi:hypothetical protein